MIWCLCIQILVRINLMSLKKTNWLQYLLEKRILCQENSCAPVANTTVFIKNHAQILKLYLKVTTRRSFVFVPWFMKKLIAFWYHDFLARWGKTASSKMKTVLYFPNHDTVIYTLVRPLTKFCHRLLNSKFMLFCQ